MSAGSSASSAGLATRMREREEARRSAVQERRREREETQREDENATHFTRQFTAQKTEIEELVAAAAALPSDQLTAHFDLISKATQSLQKYVSDSTVFLVKFELRSAQNQLVSLQQSVDQARQKLLPQKKFAFKSRKKESDGKRGEGGGRRGEGEEEEGGATVSAMVQRGSSVEVKDKRNETLTLQASEVEGQDVSISALSGCEVRLLGAASTVHISKLTSCTVLCGPVSSSVFIDECRDSTFAVACQQLRVHSTKSSAFYVHISSRAIIEDCSAVTFAPYTLSYPGLEAHLAASGVGGVNNWRKVDDFNWLASRDPSPNWSVLPENERTTFTIS